MPYMISCRIDVSAGRSDMPMVKSGLVRQLARNMIRNEYMRRTPIIYAAVSSKINVRISGYMKLMIPGLRRSASAKPVISVMRLYPAIPGIHL